MSAETPAESPECRACGVALPLGADGLCSACHADFHCSRCGVFLTALNTPNPLDFLDAVCGRCDEAVNP